MSKGNKSFGRVTSVMAALALGASALSLAAAPAAAQPMAARPSETLNISVGTGTMVRLSAPMSDLFISNDAVADVQVHALQHVALAIVGVQPLDVQDHDAAPPPVIMLPR